MIGTRHTIDINGVKISYLEHGDASLPAILFLHGWGGDALSFQPFWSALEGKSPYHLIAIDLPGFGESDMPPTPWKLNDYALCVVKYITRKNISGIHIISHSFGGRITTKLLADYPEYFTQATYIAPAGIYHPSIKRDVLKKLSHTLQPLFSLPIVRSIFPFLRSIFYRAIGAQDYLKTSGVLTETFKKIIAEDLTPLFTKITQPTQIFWGRNDSYVPVSDGTIMKNAITNAELTVFENGKHGIHKTHPKQIISRIHL